MYKIILFDIDRTLFDRDSFLGNFDKLLYKDLKLNDEHHEEIVRIYNEVKDEFGYFLPQAYLEKINKLNPRLNEKLNFYFQQENIDKHFFPDSSVLFSLKNARLGIFSKGDLVFQKIKIRKFEKVLEEDLIFIYHDKLKQIENVFYRTKGSKLFLIDDSREVLNSAKGFSSDVTTILIDRKGNVEKTYAIDFKINSLFDIISILDEKNT